MPQSVLNKEISAFLKILENCINLYYVANVCAILLAWLVYKIFVLIPTRLKTAIFENTKFPIHPTPTPSPSADSKISQATTHPTTFNHEGDPWQQSAFGKNVLGWSP